VNSIRYHFFKLTFQTHITTGPSSYDQGPQLKVKGPALNFFLRVSYTAFTNIVYAAFISISGGGKEALSMDLDFQLLEFLMDERAEGRPVSNTDLKEKARNLAADLRLEGFVGSDGYLKRWKQQNSVAVRRGTNEAQKLPEDFADHDFVQSVRNKRQVCHDICFFFKIEISINKAFIMQFKIQCLY
jgi:hypothetical protein